jgi:predicted ABC-type ATPase
VTERTPLVVVIAGPNGAGKSTTAPYLLQGALSVHEFVNADAIAVGLSAFRPESVAIAAGRIMLARLKALAGAREDFAFETTLAGRNFASWLRGLRETGYHSHLAFLSLPSVDQAVRRVAVRVQLGGHGVPEEVIRRRYIAGLRNFFGLYQAVVDSWQMFDNSGGGPAQLVASGGANQPTEVFQHDAWTNLLEQQR